MTIPNCILFVYLLYRPNPEMNPCTRDTQFESAWYKRFGPQMVRLEGYLQISLPKIMIGWVGVLLWKKPKLVSLGPTRFFLKMFDFTFRGRGGMALLCRDTNLK